MNQKYDSALRPSDGLLPLNELADLAHRTYNTYHALYNDNNNTNSILQSVNQIKNFLNGYNRAELIQRYAEIDIITLRQAITNLSKGQKIVDASNIEAQIKARQAAIKSIDTTITKINELAKDNSAMDMSKIKSKLSSYSNLLALESEKIVTSSEKYKPTDNLQNLLETAFYSDMSKIWGYITQEDIFNLYVNNYVDKEFKAISSGFKQKEIEYMTEDLKIATYKRNQIGDTHIIFNDNGILKETLVSIKTGDMFYDKSYIKSKRLQPHYKLDRIVALMVKEQKIDLMANVFYTVNKKSDTPRDSEKIKEKLNTISQIRSQYLNEFSKILWLVMFKDYFKTFKSKEFIGLLLAGTKIYTAVELFPTEQKLAQYANSVIINRTLIYNQDDSKYIFWRSNSTKYVMQYQGFKAQFAISLALKNN